MWQVIYLCSLAASLAQAQTSQENETCIMSDSNLCPVDDLTPSALDSSILIYPGGATRCAFDDFSDPNVSYTTNSTYFFQVFPASSTTKLMLYFQGGGACVDELTCAFSLQCMFETFSANAKPLSHGVLNRSNEENSFNDYNIVHLPYCTGDLHIGNSVKSDRSSGLDALLNMPECLGRNMTLHQNGYNNTKAVLDWAVENYPDPDEIIITGYSAGALGAQMLSALVADTWQVNENDIRYSVLSDSYVGVLHKDEAGGKILSYYGSCDVDLKLTDSLQDQCEESSLSFIDIVTHMILYTPSAQWLFLQSMYDQVQRYFYQLVKDGILGYPFPDLISGEDFYTKVTAIMDEYKNISDNISTFEVNNSQHVFMTDNEYYDNVIRTPGGDSLGDYLEKWLVANSSVDDDASTSASSGGGDTNQSAAIHLQHALLLTFIVIIAMLVQ
ncbi:hypothetical protein CCR75_001136 [Bremia lactucae]|uniref:Uncharacterized protein n=1 Tax=Bremia lactucae TaxID=4779 RepID=A0A976NZT5_BRELC|nr:hypothetical protein CCR75_001136 [Bremia lactucae]